MATFKNGNVSVTFADNYTPSDGQTVMYNAIGRNSGFNPLGWVGDKINSAENAIGTTISAGVDFARSGLFGGTKGNGIENITTENMLKRQKESIDDVYKKYGFNGKQDFDNQLYSAENSGNQAEADRLLNIAGLNDELKSVANANATEAKNKADAYQDYRKNSYIGQKVNQNNGKFAGSALNTLSTMADIAGMATGAPFLMIPNRIIGNGIQGAIGGVANELEQNGGNIDITRLFDKGVQTSNWDNFDWGRAGQNALIGGASGLATGAFNKLIDGKKIIGGSGDWSKLANKAIQSQIGRGALSGAVGGAVGGGISAGLNNGDVGQAMTAGALQGLASGAVNAGVMQGATKLGGAVLNKINPELAQKMADNQQMYKNWRESGKNFNERLTNTLNSGESGIGNWLNRKTSSKLLNKIGETGVGLSIKPVGTQADDLDREAMKFGERYKPFDELYNDTKNRLESQGIRATDKMIRQEIENNVLSDMAHELANGNKNNEVVKAMARRFASQEMNTPVFDRQNGSVDSNLEAIRNSIKNENVSAGELVYLQEHIPEILKAGDIELAQWAGIDEFVWNTAQGTAQSGVPQLRQDVVKNWYNTLESGDPDDFLDFMQGMNVNEAINENGERVMYFEDGNNYTAHGFRLGENDSPMAKAIIDEYEALGGEYKVNPQAKWGEAVASGNYNNLKGSDLNYRYGGNFDDAYNYTRNELSQTLGRTPTDAEVRQELSRLVYADLNDSNEPSSAVANRLAKEYASQNLKVTPEEWDNNFNGLAKQASSTAQGTKLEDPYKKFTNLRHFGLGDIEDGGFESNGNFGVVTPLSEEEVVQGIKDANIAHDMVSSSKRNIGNDNVGEALRTLINDVDDLIMEGNAVASQYAYGTEYREDMLDSVGLNLKENLKQLESDKKAYTNAGYGEYVEELGVIMNRALDRALSASKNLSNKPNSLKFGEYQVVGGNLESDMLHSKNKSQHTTNFDRYQDKQARLEQRINEKYNQSSESNPQTAKDWAKRAIKRIGEDLDNKGVGLSIKDTSGENGPSAEQTEVYRTLMGGGDDGTGGTGGDDFESGYAKSKLATGETRKSNFLSRAGRGMEALQTGATRKETRDIGIENAGELVNNVRKRTGISDIETQAQLARELTGGKDSLLDDIQRQALNATEDGSKRMVDLSDLNKPIEDLIYNASGVLLPDSEKQKLYVAVIDDMTNNKLDTIAKANNMRAVAHQLYIKDARTPDDSSKLKANILSQIAGMIEDKSYSEVPKDNVDAMFETAQRECLSRAQTATENGNRKIAKAYTKLANEIENTPHTIGDYRHLKKDFVDISKLYTKSSQAQTAWNTYSNPSLVGSAVAGAILSGHPLTAVPTAIATKMLAPAIGETANTFGAKIGGKIADFGDAISRYAIAPSTPSTDGQTVLYNMLGRENGLRSTQPTIDGSGVTGESSYTTTNEPVALLASSNDVASDVYTPTESADESTTLYNSLTNANTGTGYTTGGTSYGTQTTGNSYVDLLKGALDRASEAGDANAFGTLYQLYQNALASTSTSSNGVSDWSASDRSKLIDAQNGLSTIDELESAYNQATGEDGGNNISGTLRNWAVNLTGGNLDPSASNYNQMAQSIGIGIVKNLVNLGSQEADAQRYAEYIPTLYDTREQAQTKLETLRRLYQSQINNLYRTYGYNA